MSSGKWALEVPLHMNPDDHSPEADELRVHLYQQFLVRSRGRGFRIKAGQSPKRKNPRRGWGTSFNRIDALALNAKHGERTNGPTY